MQLKKFIEKTNGDPKKSYYTRIARAESGGNDNAVNPAKGATASGRYQFVEETWKEMVDKHNLGYSLNDRFNPEKSQKVMELFTKENENYLTKKLGRSLNDADLYSAHFLGAGGAEKFLKTVNKNPNKLATEHFSGRVLSDNKSVMYNKDGTPRTVGAVYAELGRRMGDTTASQIQEETPQQKELTDLMFTNYLPNIAGIDLGTSEEETADDKVVKETEKELQKEDRKLNAFDNYKQQQEQLAQLAPQQQTQEDTFSAIQTFQGVDQFVSQPLMQRGGRTPIYVTDKNDPRYIAYQDSLTAYNYSKNLKEKVEKTKQFPDAETNSKTSFSITGEGKSMLPKTKLEKLMSHPDSNPIKDFSKYNEGTEEPMRPIDVLKYPSDKWYSPVAGTLPIYKKPEQPILLKKGETKNIPTSTQKDKTQTVKQRPKVQGLNASITPAGIQTQQELPQGEELPQRTYAQIPTSYNVSSQRYNMQGENPYYNFNAENVDSQTAIRANLSAENYNADIERRYGNEEALKNPKAVERLKQLRQEVSITPNYQNGGGINNLEQLRNKFRETLKLQRGGKIPVSPNGLYDYPNQTVRVPTDGSITMKKINYPVLGTSDQTGEQKLMLPNLEYFFSKTNSVTERPLKK